MQSLPALRTGTLALAYVLTPAAHATGTIELLTGIPRLACEATLCLSSSLRPGECSSSLDHYFGIKKFNRHELDWTATVAARRDFLSACPAASDHGTDTSGFTLRLLDAGAEIGSGQFCTQSKSGPFADEQAVYDEALATGRSWLADKQAAVFPEPSY